MLKFGPYLPDLPAYENPGLVDARNVTPAEGFYRPFHDLSPYSAALGSRCIGAFTAKDTSGNVNLFAGTTTKLNRLSGSGTAWEDVSDASCSATTYYSFCQFGSVVIATGLDNNVKAYTLGGSTDFANLAGSPPKAQFCAVVRDFVMLAKLDTLPQRVRWCAFDDPTDWTVAAATQADYQDLVGDGGPISGIVGGEYAVIFQERAVFRATYIGPPLVFQFDRIEQARGTRAPGSIAAIGTMIFYLAEDGFYMFNGMQSVPIGQGKLDRTFLADLDDSNIERISSGIDPVNRLYCVAYPGQGNASGTPNRMLIVHWPTGNWAIVETMVEILFAGASSLGYTLEDLDNISSSLDALPASLDDGQWSGGVVRFAAFDSDHKLGYFTGDTLQATFETGDAQIYPGRRSFIRSVRPMIEGECSIDVTIATKNRLNDDLVYGSPSPQNAIGECPQRANGRYVRAKTVIAAGGSWTKAVGLDFDATAEGIR